MSETLHRRHVDSHFMTCLAEGMSVGTLLVAARGQLDAPAHKLTTLRERMAVAAGVDFDPCFVPDPSTSTIRPTDLRSRPPGP